MSPTGTEILKEVLAEIEAMTIEEYKRLFEESKDFPTTFTRIETIQVNVGLSYGRISPTINYWSPNLPQTQVFDLPETAFGADAIPLIAA